MGNTTITHKICTKCSIRKELEYFRTDNSRNSRVKQPCILCDREATRRRLVMIRKRPGYNEYANKKKSEWRERYPEKAKAHMLAMAHKKKIKKFSCEACGITEKLQMHHPDYSKPLEVITLCRMCHEAVHHRVVI